MKKGDRKGDSLLGTSKGTVFLFFLVAVLAACIAGLPEAASAQAGAADKASSLDELLGEIRRGGEAEEQENLRREEEFRAAKAEQQQMLSRARAEKEAAEQRSAELEAIYEQSEAEIPKLEETLRSRLGTLGELFGIVRQTAGDTRGFVEQSLVSAQLTGREEFLSQLAQSREMASIEDMERLWYVLQQEMTESGKVVRFPATVIQVGGGQEQRQAVRVGPFVATSNGEYLQYLPETGRLAELARQPASRHVATVEDLENAKTGYVGISIDPSRGSILALLIQTPSLGERIQQGGIVGYVIIGLGMVAAFIVVYRLFFLGVAGRKMRTQMSSRVPNRNNALGRVLAAYHDHRTSDVETLELKLDEAILKETPALERGNAMIKVLSIVAPLLGLLGTVTGMIETFQAITLFGTGDPKLMASGISQALVTTVLGLTMAIPLTLLHSIVASRSKALIQILEEESAGIVAAHAEHTQGPGGLRAVVS